MRLSFITSSLRLSGGVQVIAEYANRLAERGHEVAIITPRKAIDAEISTRLSPVVRVSESALVLQPRARLIYQVRLSVSMARAVPASDLVVATHTPTIVPTLMATFGNSQRRLWLYMDYPEMFASRPVERWLLRRGPAWFEQILTLSEAGRQDVVRAGARAALVVGLGLSEKELFVPHRSARKNANPVMMYLGDSRPRKGLPEFLAAAEIVRKKVPGLSLLLVSKETVRVNSPLPCEIVLRPDRRALPGLYRRSDVFVFPSWGEGFGLPPLEAMACGVPVVLTDSRGVRDYARHEENCLMVPPRDVARLAEAITRVLTEEGMARMLGDAGITTARRFQWDACVDRFEASLGTLV